MAPAAVPTNFLINVSRNCCCCSPSPMLPPPSSLHQSCSLPILLLTNSKLPPLPSSLLLSNRRRRGRRHRHCTPKASSISSSSSFFDGFPAQEKPGNSGGLGQLGFFDRLRAFLPGGSWWKLEEEDTDKGDVEEERKNYASKGMPVILALRKMWDLVAKERWVISLAFASLFFAAISEVSIPNFLAASIFSAQSGESMTFYRNVKLLLFLCFTSGISSGLRGCCFGIANMLLVRRMRETLYNALLFQDVSFFDEETVGDLTSRLGADCQQVSRVLGNDLNMISRSVLQGTGALIYLLILSWPLALSTILICFVLAMIMLIYGQYQKTAAKLTQECTASANEVSQETLSLIRTVRVYGTEKREFGRYMTWLESLFDISLRQSLAYGYWNLSFNYLYHSTQVIAVLAGGVSIMHGYITAEQLTKFIMYCEWLIYSTWRVGDSWSSLMQSIGATEKVFQLIDLLPSKQFLSEGLKLQKLEGRIDFVNVSFHYPSRTTVQALQHVNISINSNEVVAFVGPSGSGKSTLVSLLLRLYEPTDGQILVDGTPLTKLDIKWLRERIGYVGQEPRLFRMDVNSNIRYGCTRKISQEEVECIAKQAFAHDFIMSLPNGYSTLVDDTLLSGGQKQRIAIARALLRDPTILILDEATSALDAESEYYVKGILRNTSMAKRTVLIIAHRLSTVQAADKIVVMDDGIIAEMGNHVDLIHKNGLYAQLVKCQADAFSC